MEKNLLTKLSVLALVGLMTFTGCSKAPMFKEDLKAGDVYVTKASFSQTSEDYLQGEDTFVFNTEAKYDSTATIGDKDKDKNTAVSVKYDNYSVTYSSPASDSAEFVAECNQEGIEECKQINSVNNALTGRIDSFGILFETTTSPELQENESFVSSGVDFLSGTGKLGVVKENDTWDLKVIYTCSNNEVLNVIYKMKCTKIDDNKIYVTGIGKASKNGAIYDGKITMEVSRENVLVSKLTTDLTLTEPSDTGNPSDKTIYKSHETTETTKKK